MAFAAGRTFRTSAFRTSAFGTGSFRTRRTRPALRPGTARFTTLSLFLIRVLALAASAVPLRSFPRLRRRSAFERSCVHICYWGRRRRRRLGRGHNRDSLERFGERRAFPSRFNRWGPACRGFACRSFARDFVLCRFRFVHNLRILPPQQRRSLEIPIRGDRDQASAASLAHSSATRPAGRNLTVTALRPIKSAIRTVLAFSYSPRCRDPAWRVAREADSIRRMRR